MAASIVTDCFNLANFNALFSSRGQVRRDLVFMSRTAEAAERYDDMCKFMKELVSWASTNNEDLTVEERNLLSVAYKNVIGSRRASWRTLHAEEEDDLVAVYKGQVEQELEITCKEILSLLEDTLVPNSKPGQNDDALVFYLKMTGDYYRYLAESAEGQGHEKKAASFYGEAFEIADKSLEPTHPIRLGLALNYSVCFYEILKDKKKACDLAKKAFDEAISKLDKLEEVDYKDSTLIMQLLRDNLTLWTSSDEADAGDGTQVEDLQ